MRAPPPGSAVIFTKHLPGQFQSLAASRLRLVEPATIAQYIRQDLQAPSQGSRHHSQPGLVAAHGQPLASQRFGLLPLTALEGNPRELREVAGTDYIPVREQASTSFEGFAEQGLSLVQAPQFAPYNLREIGNAHEGIRVVRMRLSLSINDAPQDCFRFD